MGFETNKGRVIYANLKKGMWAIKKDGEEQLFDKYTGILTEIEFKDEEYQGEKYVKVCLTVVDGDERVLLQFRWDSGYSRGFVQAIGNVDLSQRITFAPSYKVVDGKTKTTMFLNQHGKAAKWTWTKENMGELPPMNKVKIKGKEVWDNGDQQEFFKTFIETKIIPNLVPEVIAGGEKHEAVESLPEFPKGKKKAVPVEEAEDPDGLPF